MLWRILPTLGTSGLSFWNSGHRSVDWTIFHHSSLLTLHSFHSCWGCRSISLWVTWHFFPSWQLMWLNAPKVNMISLASWPFPEQDHRRDHAVTLPKLSEISFYQMMRTGSSTHNFILQIIQSLLCDFLWNETNCWCSTWQFAHGNQ